VIADQRAYPRGLAANDVECVDACDLDVERGARVFVEQANRLPGRDIPVAVDGAIVATDPMQFGLKQAWYVFGGGSDRFRIRLASVEAGRVPRSGPFPAARKESCKN